MRRLRQIEAEFSEIGQVATVEDLAEKTSIPVEQVQSLLRIVRNKSNVCSLEALNSNKADTKSYEQNGQNTLKGLLISQSSPTSVLDDDRLHDAEALRTDFGLDEQDALVLELRYGLLYTYQPPADYKAMGDFLNQSVYEVKLTSERAMTSLRENKQYKQLAYL
jgi:DNA-directed RNA polymerase sigma subunit (sigma70/sigma32)